MPVIPQTIQTIVFVFLLLTVVSGLILKKKGIIKPELEKRILKQNKVNDNQKDTSIENLEKIVQMKEKGMLTEDEFNKLKSRYI